MRKREEGGRDSTSGERTQSTYITLDHPLWLPALWPRPHITAPHYIITEQVVGHAKVSSTSQGQLSGRATPYSVPMWGSCGEYDATMRSVICQQNRFMLAVLTFHQRVNLKPATVQSES